MSRILFDSNGLRLSTSTEFSGRLITPTDISLLAGTRIHDENLKDAHLLDSGVIPTFQAILQHDVVDRASNLYQVEDD